MNEIKKYKAAAVQFNPKLSNKDGNIIMLLNYAKEAAKNGAKLIVLPEMGTTGYCYFSREEISSMVEPIPGPSILPFISICEDYKCFIVVGLPEVDIETNIYYNSCALLGPSGLIGKYRKTHPFASEPKWAKVGNLGLPVFKTEIGHIGCAICMDFYFFEPSRLLALSGADVICNLTNWLYEKAPAPSWFTRAWENSVYLISADRSDLERGQQFSGGTSIISPDQTVQNYIDKEEGIVYGEIDLDRARKNDISGYNLFEDRKSDLYHSLTLNTYHFNPYIFHRLYDHNPLPKGSSFVLAVAQMVSISSNTVENISKVSHFATEAKKLNAEVLVLPELALSGINNTYEYALTNSIELNKNQIFGQLVDIAAKNNIYLVLGIVEKEKDNLYNTIILISKQGLIGKYRKVHLNNNDIIWANEGKEGFPWFDLPIGRIGLLTANDLFFPESTMCQAVWGADIILVCGAINGPKPIPLPATEILLPLAKTEYDPVHWHLGRVRAAETNTYIAFANQCAPNYMGFSGIFGPTDLPRNEIITSDSSDELLVLKVRTNENDNGYPQLLVRAKDQVRMRFPQLYDLLVRSSVKSDI